MPVCETCGEEKEGGWGGDEHFWCHGCLSNVSDGALKETEHEKGEEFGYDPDRSY